jgi:hypothetical protein
MYYAAAECIAYVGRQMRHAMITSTWSRHVPQLSGNGREDGQKGKYRAEKYWDSEIIIDNQQKKWSSRAEPQKREVTILRQGELGYAAGRYSTTEEERYGSSKTNNRILFGNAGPAFGQTT